MPSIYPFPQGDFRVGREYVFPQGWLRAIEDVAARHVVRVASRDAASTTHERGRGEVLEYWVVDDTAVATHLPSLRAAYETYLADFVREAMASAVRCAADEHVGVNINVMHPAESSYRWHYDSNSPTGLVLVDTISVDDGESIDVLFDGKDYSIPSIQGRSVVFDGLRLPHSVSPPSHTTRHSIDPKYYLEDDVAVRPADVDEHTYGAAAG